MFASLRKEIYAKFVLSGLLWASLSFGQAPTPAPGQGPVETKYTNVMGVGEFLLTGTQRQLLQGTSIPIRLYATGSEGANFPYQWVSAAGQNHSGTVTDFVRQITAGAQMWRDLARPMTVTLDTANSQLPPLTHGIQIFLLNTRYPTAAGRPQHFIGTLAETTIFAVPRIIEIYMPEIAAAAARDFLTLRTDGVLPATFTLDQTIDLYLRYAVIHELGHALGLDHPEGDALMGGIIERIRPNLEGRMEHIHGPGAPAVDVVYNENPSIMTTHVEAWLRQMYSRWRRSIGMSDVSPTRRDIAGANYLWGDSRGYAASCFSCFNTMGHSPDEL